MINNLYAFLLSFSASIATIIGSLICLFAKKTNKSLLIFSLSFASGVMLFVSIFDLIPSGYNMFNQNTFLKTILSLIFINLGIILSNILDNKIGDEKGTLYKVGIINLIAIMLHNILEGIITYITTSNNLTLGIKISLAILLHNIPEGISISIPIYYATKSKKKALIYSFIAGISEVIGAIISYFFLSKYITNNILGIIYLITSGVMIYISIFEMLKNSLKETKNIKKIFIYMLIGIIIMLITHIL